MKKNRISILDVPFDALSFEEALQTMKEASLKEDQLHIVTPNPEICLEASKNPDFLKVLCSAGLSVADGFGILWASRLLSGKRFSPLPERITGTDLMSEFCKRHPQQKIFLLGASEKVNTKLTAKLHAEGVRVVGNFSGSPRYEEEEQIIKKIHDTGAEVLFVAFGAPHQELWIGRNLPKLPAVHVVMGVGGAFDFLSGEKKRAPKILQRLGLEWAYRLFKEPKRFKRIFNATIVFPVKVLTSSRKKVP